ncbi:MAG: hypothetical protein ACRDM1_04115 [Gaiellaceae bacterium]
MKQAEDRRPEQVLRQEGSSAASAAWSSSHRNPVICDGRPHTATFTVDQVEYGWGELQPGQGWVQFCLGDASGAFVSRTRFASVR